MNKIIPTRPHRESGSDCYCEAAQPVRGCAVPCAEAGIGRTAQGARLVRAVRDVAWARGIEFGDGLGVELVDGTHAFLTRVLADEAVSRARMIEAACVRLPPRWSFAVRPFNHRNGVPVDEPRSGYWVSLLDDQGREAGRI